MDLELLGRGVLLLDNPVERSRRVADNPAEPGWIAEVRGKDCKPPVRDCCDHPAERGDGKQGSVAVDHKDDVIVLDVGHGLPDRVPGAELLGLVDPVDVLKVCHVLPDLIAAEAVYDVDAGRPELACRVVDPPEHGLTANLMKHFRLVGAHARSLAGRENKNLQRHRNLGICFSALLTRTDLNYTTRRGRARLRCVT